MCDFALEVRSFRKGFLLRGFSDKRQPCTLEDWVSLADSSCWLTSPVKSCSTAGDLELFSVALWFHGGVTLKPQYLKLVSTEYRGAGSNFKRCFNLKARRRCDISMLVGMSERANSAQVWVLYRVGLAWLVVL